MAESNLNAMLDRSGVPSTALLLSLMSLWVPVVSSSFFPAWTNSDVGILVWLLALVPAFLLSYYRGWRGSSVALAGGMVAFTAAQVMVSLTGTALPRPEVLLGAIVVLMAVALGSGALSTVFRRSLRLAELRALTDGMTGLANRRHVMEFLQHGFAAAVRGEPVSVALFDLDLFKRVNDEHGHHVGDQVLMEFARILETNTRDMDLSARFGGEEFLTVLQGTDGDAAVQFAERVRRMLGERCWSWGSVTVSAGVSEFEPGMASPDVLVAAADQALYRAKQAGRNRVVRVGKQGRSQDLTVHLNRPASQDDRANGELILLVDDDASVLRTLGMALRRKGYRVLESEHPLRALEIAQGLDEPLDLVLADVVMPDMSGFRFVEILTRQQPAVRALYISGYGREAVEWAGVPGAVKAFLPKPFTLDALSAAVRRTLDADPAGVAEESRAWRGDGGSPAPEPEVVVGTGAALRARLTAQDAQLQEAYSELLLRLARAAEYRDDDTGQHAERVGILAGLLAEEMGLDAATVARLTIAAPLHDIGKIAVPDAILKKPGTLTPAERAIMNEHCEAGAELLSGSSNPFVREAEAIARSHHERWDGCGYPRGLRAEAIPLAARVTSVADTFDSITHVRPYRGQRPWTEAVAVIRAQRGRQFDPDVVDALVRLAESGKLEGEAYATVFGASHVAEETASGGS